MNVNSDKISEKFRKYVIEVILKNDNRVYLLWGTDQSNSDMDYLLVNDKNEILAFCEISELLNFVNTGEIKIDPTGTKQWSKSYRENMPYAVYDLLRIKNQLTIGINLSSLEKDDAILIVNFINLFSDYAYQTGKKKLVEKVNNRQVKIFKDYVLGKFFWDTSGQEETLLRLVERFDFATFRNNKLKMIEIFQNCIVNVTHKKAG